MELWLRYVLDLVAFFDRSQPVGHVYGGAFKSEAFPFCIFFYPLLEISCWDIRACIRCLPVHGFSLREHVH
jgi:hypothetical protein